MPEPISIEQALKKRNMTVGLYSFACIGVGCFLEYLVRATIR